MEQKSLFARWRSSFLTGLAVTLPALLTLAALKWLIGTISGVTDLLLFFLPRSLTHEGLIYPHDGKGEIYGYWSLVALVLAVVLISVVGVLARYYIGKKIIEWTDRVLMRVPLLNKFYGAIKQVNDANIRSRPSCSWNFRAKASTPSAFSPVNNATRCNRKPGKRSCACLSPRRRIPHRAF